MSFSLLCFFKLGFTTVTPVAPCFTPVLINLASLIGSLISGISIFFVWSRSMLTMLVVRFSLNIGRAGFFSGTAG